MEKEKPISLQDKYAPHSECFGCGPSNPKGLQVKTIPKGDHTEAEWTPQKYHEAFPGCLNGGVIGALLDCHSNWTTAWHLMKTSGVETPPCTVTSDFHVKLLRPTPTNDTIKIEAKIIDAKPDRATVEAKLTAGGKVCATCVGTFVAVTPGHPAYHRW